MPNPSTKPVSTPRLLTYDQAAAYLNLPVGTLHAWVREGRVPHLRLGPRTVRFRRGDLDAWTDDHLVGAACPPDLDRNTVSMSPPPITTTRTRPRCSSTAFAVKACPSATPPQSASARRHR